MNQNILEIRHLSKDYGTFRLEDVSFSLPRGVIMGLIGGEWRREIHHHQLHLGGGAEERRGTSPSSAKHKLPARRRTRTGSGWCLTKTTFRTSSPPKSWAR